MLITLKCSYILKNHIKNPISKTGRNQKCYGQKKANHSLMVGLNRSCAMKKTSNKYQ